MNKEEYINNIKKKSKIRKDGRRGYKEKLFTHFVWNLYHPEDPVKKDEVIHHKNEDILDDDIDKLEKMKRGEHTILHKTGFSHTEETRKKLSKAVIGKKHSEKTKRKMSEAHRGKKLSKETKEKMSEAKKEISDETRKKISETQKGSRNSMYGKKHTKEAREKMSKALKGRKHKEN